MYPQSTCNNCHLKVTYMYSIIYCILSYSTMVLVSCSFFVYCLCCCVLFASWFIGIRWHWQQYDNYLEMRLALRCRSVDLESLGTTCCPSWCLLLPDRTTSWTETAHSVSHPPPHSIWYLHSFVHCYSHSMYCCTRGLCAASGMIVGMSYDSVVAVLRSFLPISVLLTGVQGTGDAWQIDEVVHVRFTIIIDSSLSIHVHVHVYNSLTLQPRGLTVS